MGTLSYDRVVVEFDDRILTHLQVVIVQKLRRGESFLFSWRNAVEVGDGRSSAWMHPAIPLYFKFTGGHAPSLNPEWIAQLTRSANSSQGLIATSEERCIDSGHSGGANVSFAVKPAAALPKSSIASPE
ncbi:DUF7882 family protein [Cryobacterium sp. AP23]